jgi:hypothetical protein
MDEEKSVNLHFFVKEHADEFAKVCDTHYIKFCMRHDPEGYYVKTDPVTLVRRRELVKAWAAVTVK